MATGPAVVDYTLVPCSAALAAVGVADQHVLAMAGEVAERVALAAVAGGAQPGGWPAGCHRLDRIKAAAGIGARTIITQIDGDKNNYHQLK